MHMSVESKIQRRMDSQYASAREEESRAPILAPIRRWNLSEDMRTSNCQAFNPAAVTTTIIIHSD